MSKASEWASSHALGETFSHSVQRQRDAGIVTANGSLQLKDVALSQQEALAFARWILATFEDGSPVGPPPIPPDSRITIGRLDGKPIK